MGGVNNSMEDSITYEVAKRLGWGALSYNRFGMMIGTPPGLKHIRPVPKYGRTMQDTWLVVEWLIENKFDVIVATEKHGGNVVMFKSQIVKGTDRLAMVRDLSAARSIALAFLKLEDK